MRTSISGTARRTRGNRPSKTRAAIRAAATSPGRRSGRIAYSYGIDPANDSHEYPSDVAGGLGHPHPVAVAAYEARGWLQRRNTSLRAGHAGPLGDDHPRHKRGHVGLGWDATNDAPLAAGVDVYVCTRCGLRLPLNL